VFDPQKVRDRPSLAELQRKCDTSKPLAMFRSTETEFILCYDCKSYLQCLTDIQRSVSTSIAMASLIGTGKQSNGRADQIAWPSIHPTSCSYRRLLSRYGTSITPNCYKSIPEATFISPGSECKALKALTKQWHRWNG